VTLFYLRNVTSAQAPSGGSRSTALPTGTANNQSGALSLSLLESVGSSQTSVSFSTVAQTAVQSGILARFTSDPLGAQTISAQTWTLFQRTFETNGQANIFSAGSIYVFRPSNNTVVGYVYDSSADIEMNFRSAAPLHEWESTSPGSTGLGTVVGSEVACLQGDVLVFEAWYTAAQGKSTSYANNLFYFNGVSATPGTTDAAAYIEAPQTFTYATGGNALTETRTDSVGITDATTETLVKPIIETRTDSVGLTDTATETLIKPATVPDAVTNLAGVAGNAQVTLTWTAPADNGSAITDYIVQYREA
jgi:hypothetical protein